MRVLLTPAVALMNRLTYPLKFTVLGLLSFLVIGFLLMSLAIELRSNIVASEKELAGLKIVQPTLQLIHQTQQHRDGVGSVLRGKADLKPKVQDTAKNLEQTLKTLEDKKASVDAKLFTDEPWKKIQTSWKSIKGDWEEQTPQTGFNAHTELIRDMFEMLSITSDASGLSKDPDLASYYLLQAALLTIPQTNEQMAQLRDAGINVLTRTNIPITDDERLRFSHYLGTFSKLTEDLKTSINRAVRGNAELKTTLEGFHQKFSGAFEELRLATQNELSTGRREVTPDVFYNKASTTIDLAFNEIMSNLLPTAESLIQHRISRLSTQFYATAAISALFIFLFAYLCLGAYTAIMDSIVQISRGANALSKGELTTRLQLNCKDELMVVANRFNAMASSFGDLIQQIQRSAAQVATAADHLASVSHIVSEKSERQSAAAATIATAVQQMSASVEGISRSAQHAQSMSEESGQLSTLGAREAVNTASEIMRISESVSKTSGHMDDLGRRSITITAIIKTIKEIAEQTNLLALNAAIEAARAGESGRGFSIVADEVRKLAERTTNSTQEISDMVLGIQDGTNIAASTMQEGVARVKGGVELANKAGATMSRVSEEAGKVVATINEISHAISEQSAASSEIAHKIEEISQMAEESHTAIEQTTDTARELQTLASNLHVEIGRFKV